MWFEVYLDNENKWRWRLCQLSSSGNKLIYATGHQGYNEKSICEIDIKNVKLTNESTPIRYV
ncbi:hypothetical protein MUU45_001160 [Rodentibacter pneumotropicus]|uniref:DUF1508 domain-containing protein n=1 Tax=Rodentibacter pneumotropicus TaxID=758 RepID=A0AAW5LDT6_9PAST|nr:hypothetical protein [Rodentibacter pneumotropicus]MCQ9121610.1 hypothetical protein [Rodentibacter pneumotropicus]